jgi:hypothetical protein
MVNFHVCTFEQTALPVVQKRIAQGGVRLAAILNKIFGGNSRPQGS